MPTVHHTKTEFAPDGSGVILHARVLDGPWAGHETQVSVPEAALYARVAEPGAEWGNAEAAAELTARLTDPTPLVIVVTPPAPVGG